LPYSTTFQIESNSIFKFIKVVGNRNKNSAKQYQSRLLLLERFAKDYYNNNKKYNKLFVIARKNKYKKIKKIFKVWIDKLS